MGRPFSVEHIVLAYGAEDPRFESLGAMPEKVFFGSLQMAPNECLGPPSDRFSFGFSIELI